MNELHIVRSKSLNLLFGQRFGKSFLEEWVCAVDVLKYDGRWEFKAASPCGRKLGRNSAQESYSLITFTQDAEIDRLEFQCSPGAAGMNGPGKQRFADPRLSDDHKGLGIGGELGNSRLESRDGGAVAYDLDGIQSSGPGMTTKRSDRFEPLRTKRFFPANGLWTQKVSGLWTRFSEEEKYAGCVAIRGYRYIGWYKNAWMVLKVICWI
jgi:hypothetical protein